MAISTDRYAKKHMYIHTLPVQCEQCDVRVANTGTLKGHVRKLHDQIKIECRFGCGWKTWSRQAVGRHEKESCKLNPVPHASYSVAMGTANKLTLERYHANLKE